MNPRRLFLRPAAAHHPDDHCRSVSEAEKELSLEHGAHYQSQLESENLRLRAERVTLRTVLFWGLGHAALSRPAHPRRSLSKAVTDPALGDAHRAICQTGCVGHAHH